MENWWEGTCADRFKSSRPNFKKRERFASLQRQAVSYSYAFIALPGGFGTLDEIFETATLIQTHKIKDFPLVLVGKEYWQPLLDFLRGQLVEAKTIDPIDAERILLTDSAEEAVQLAHDAAVRQFGLSYGPKIKRRWFLWDRSGMLDAALLVGVWELCRHRVRTHFPRSSRN